jgi:hypothetical protein
LPTTGRKKEETKIKEGNSKEHKRKIVSEDQGRKKARKEGKEDSVHQTTKETGCKSGPL